MPVKSFKVGAGTLKLGTAGAQDASAQVANCRVEWEESVSTTAAVPLLDGGELAEQEDVTHRAKLVGNVVQDIDAAGLVAYTWTNKGAEVDAEFIPNTAEDRKVTGVVRIVPLTLGGDVSKRNQSDFSWTFIGDPILADI